MAQGSRKRPRAHVAGGGEDRLSDLPDGVLGHILSFLPTKEAGRAALLARRWRHVFANVHTLSFVDEDHDAEDGDTFYYEAEERRSRNGDFLDGVSAALLCRRRCGGLAPNSSLRAFRVAFDDYHRWDGAMVTQWLYHLMEQSKQELHLDLRLQADRACHRDGAAEDSDSDVEVSEHVEHRYRLPRRLFSLGALRSLRVSYCKLNPPAAIALPGVETLHLTGMRESWGTIRRLISGCPRLVDLTLEACAKVKRVSILDRRLRRFALRCCHDAVSVSLDASELRTLDYRGAVPAKSFLDLRGVPRTSSCTAGLCGLGLSGAAMDDDDDNEDGNAKVAGFRKFLENFMEVTHLHLMSSRLGCMIGLIRGVPTFWSLKQLELTGRLDKCSTVEAVARILEHAPNLEVLSLFLVPMSSSRMHSWEDDIRCDNGVVAVPDMPDVSVRCLRRRVRRINLVHYQGGEAQRMLAELLLRNAMVLEELRVVFPKGGRLAVQAELMDEMEEWTVNKSAKKMFL
ncbi:hypothetical protein ACP70R_004933 [Stipagrostis hirtigluma subsp. patula]